MGALLGEQYCCIIEVRIPSGPKVWEDTVNDKMKQILEKFKLSIEELVVKFISGTGAAQDFLCGFYVDFEVASAE